MALSVAPPRFPLLGKIVAIVLVLLALVVALQIGFRHRGRARRPASRGRGQRRRQPRRQPDGARPDPAARLQRDLGGGAGRGQGKEGGDRAPLLEAGRRAGRPGGHRPGGPRAALPRHLQGQRLRDEGDGGRELAGRRWPATQGRARRLTPRLRAADGAAGTRRLARRAQRHGPGRRPVGRGPARHRPPGARPRLPRGHRRRLGRLGPTARGADDDRAGRHRRAGVRAGRRLDPGRAGLGLAASVVRRPLPAAGAHRHARPASMPPGS